MTIFDRIAKRSFDIAVALIGVGLTGGIMGISALCAYCETERNPVFRQQRIGRRGKLFFMYKIRTMRDARALTSTVTTERDPRITRVGRWLRRWKIDELPQLFNVLRGDMSLVGPRPEVPSYLSQIEQQAPLVLSVRPGITGPASLKYRDEERLLAAQTDPQTFNDLVIFPDKLRINERYVRYYRFAADLKYLWHTVLGRRDETVKLDSMPHAPQRQAA